MNQFYIEINEIPVKGESFSYWAACVVRRYKLFGFIPSKERIYVDIQPQGQAPLYYMGEWYSSSLGYQYMTDAIKYAQIKLIKIRDSKGRDPWFITIS